MHRSQTGQATARWIPPSPTSHAKTRSVTAHNHQPRTLTEDWAHFPALGSSFVLRQISRNTVFPPPCSLVQVRHRSLILIHYNHLLEITQLRGWSHASQRADPRRFPIQGSTGICIIQSMCLWRPRAHTGETLDTITVHTRVFPRRYEP